MAGTASCCLSAAEFTAKIIDGLGRPLPGAIFEVEAPQKGLDGKVKRTEWLKLSSDRDGLVKGRYDEQVTPATELSVYVKKEGYSGYSTGLRTEYVLKQEFQSKDIRRIARLHGEAQSKELRELLGGEFERDSRKESEDFWELMFFHERACRPALRALIQDARVGEEIAKLLAFIGVPEDLRLVIQHARPPKRKLFEDRWAYYVATALLEPTTEGEWEFLRKCAVNEYDDRWVDAGAIVALKLIASPRSLEILQECWKKNKSREKMLTNAAEYVESKPPSLADANLVESGKKVAQAIKIGDWQENKEPRFNEDGDKALIDCEFIAGRDLLIYTATFHKVGDIWKLRGVRETLQVLLALPPDRKKFIGLWHGYDEDHLHFARLELNEDNRGLLTIIYTPDLSPATYRVKQWSQRRYKLEITVEPADQEAELITLQKVTLGIGSLEFEVHGKGGWSREMTLFNETEFKNNAEAAKKSMEKMLKSK